MIIVERNTAMAWSFDWPNTD